MSQKHLSVVFLVRYPAERSYSIESVFQTIREHLPTDIVPSVIISEFPSRGLFLRFRAMLHARKACKGADIIHMTGDAHFLTFLLPRRRVVLTIHDCVFLERSTGLKRFLLWLIWIKLPSLKSKKITVVSSEGKAQLQRWLRVDPNRIEVVENPLSKVLTTDLRPFNTAHARILMIGTGSHKNIDRVAKALVGHPVSLDVIGRLSNDHLERLRKDGLNINNSYGLSDAELAQAYADCDIMMFPSLAEGFGLPILEAQAVGRPVITSNRAPMTDVAGSAALFVDPEDAKAIGDAVTELMTNNDLREHLVQQGLENIKRFSPDVAAARYADVYRHVSKEL